MNKNNLTKKQQQQLQEIGSKLKDIRVEKSISLESIANKTRISQRLLTAIEEADLEELPEPFYIRALVKKFAKELGAHNIEFEAATASQEEIEQSKLKVKRKYWLNFQLRSLHLYLMYIFLVILSVKGITILVERPVIVNQVPTEKPPIDIQQPESEPVASNGSSAVAPQFVSQSSNSDSVTVGINLQERCWLKVMVDGQVAFEGILPKGTQRQWSGERQVTIRAGNAGGVVISFNNEQQKILGAPGQVEEITYTVN